VSVISTSASGTTAFARIGHDTGQPPVVVVWAFMSSGRAAARRRAENNKPIGRNLIEPPQELRSGETRDQQNGMTSYLPNCAPYENC
jgi:hypothetical protein